MPDASLQHKSNRVLSPGRTTPAGTLSAEESILRFSHSTQRKSTCSCSTSRTGRPPMSSACSTAPNMSGMRSCTAWGRTALRLQGQGRIQRCAGCRFNEHKLLLDPCAAALTGKCVNDDNLLLGYDALSVARDLIPDTRDNTLQMPKCIVVDQAFDWQGDRRLEAPLERLVIYEVHVKASRRIRPPESPGRVPTWASSRKSHT